MAPKSSVLGVLLLLVVVPRGGAEADGTTASGNIAANVVISGKVPCSNGTSIDMAVAPAFPNATVQLVCDGSVVASATTDVTGSFVVNLQGGNVFRLQNLLAALLANQCSVVVTTPLVACNASLAGATGTLTAPLHIQGSGAAAGSGGGLISVLAGAFSNI